jgi:hypothetical protein
MALAVESKTLSDLEKELRFYAKKLIDGDIGNSKLAEAFGKVIPSSSVRNIPTIANEFIARVTDELVIAGVPRVAAKRRAKATVNDHVNKVLVSIN